MNNKIFNQPIWQTDFLSSNFQEYIYLIILFFVFLITFKIFQTIILNYLKRLALKTKTDIDDTFVEIIYTIKPPFYSFLAFYLSLQFINIHFIIQNIINIVLIFWVTYLIISALQILIDFVAKKYIKKDGGSESVIRLISTIVKTILWSLGIILILSNLGIDVTSLVAGLGIGGLAIALALQNILADLFSSFAIHFDKPFAKGDFIITGDKMGVVEKIGIKTTRIRALQGEEIIIANQELTSAQIQNFKKMKERRISFSFGVIYQTNNEKLKKIPQIIKSIIEPIDQVRFDRAHFTKFNNSSLDFEIVYYVQSSDYNKYMDIQQEINLQIRAIFEKESIDMAYPTQTIYLNK